MKLAEIVGWSDRFAMDFNPYMDLQGEDEPKVFLARACVALIERITE